MFFLHVYVSGALLTRLFFRDFTTYLTQEKEEKAREVEALKAELAAVKAECEEHKKRCEDLSTAQSNGENITRQSTESTGKGDNTLVDTVPVALETGGDDKDSTQLAGGVTKSSGNVSVGLDLLPMFTKYVDTLLTSILSIYSYLQDESKAVYPANTQASDSTSLSVKQKGVESNVSSPDAEVVTDVFTEERRSISSGGVSSLSSGSNDTSAAAATIAQGTGGGGNPDRGRNDGDETDKEVS